jgi:hypothetical protein
LIVVIAFLPFCQERFSFISIQLELKGKVKSGTSRDNGYRCF